MNKTCTGFPSTIAMNGTNGTNGTNGIGVPGATGATGPTGNPGTNGTNGTNGVNGITPTISAGSATTISYGSSPTASNTGTSTNAIFNFGIPAGQPGSNGSNGTDGVNANAGTHVSMWHDESTVTVGNPFTYFNSNFAYYTVTYQSPSLINDSFYQSFVLQPGTYTLYVLCELYAVNGIVTWTLDGTVIGTLDFYSAAGGNPTLNIPGVVVTGQNHILVGSIVSKNSLSTGYQATLTKYWFK